MEKRTSAVARILAALALAGAVIAVVVVVSGAVNSNSPSTRHHGSGHVAKKGQRQPRTKAATYEVQTGDTLIAIARTRPGSRSPRSWR
ncbi:MAG: hypothetical protein U0R26_02965 [Solirubrobacterales bacterium]